MAVSPVFQNIGGLTNATPDLLVGKQGDFGPSSVSAITIYNVSHNYLSINTNAFNGFISGITTSLLMRYE